MVVWYSKRCWYQTPGIIFLGRRVTGSRPKRITLSQQGRTGSGVRMDSAFGIRCYVVVVDLAEAVLVVVPNARVLQSMRNPGAMICFCGYDIRRIK